VSGRGWRFKDKTPLWFTLLGGLLLADAAMRFGLASTVSMWAQASPDAGHTYRVPFRDGSIYFASAFVGKYIDSWWTSAVLFVVLAVLLFLNRALLERSGD
jgi:hypothetical protein